MLAYIQTTPWHEERYRDAQELRAWLQATGVEAFLVTDDRTEDERKREPTGFLAFTRALATVPEPGAWFIEDDAVLTSNFAGRARWEVRRHPNHILQAYSTEKKDLSWGERWRSPKSFGSNLCVYYPSYIASDIAAFSAIWTKPEERPYREKDIVVRAFLVAHRMSYWQVVPNLATPRAGFSVRQGRRFAQPASLTFEP